MEEKKKTVIIRNVYYEIFCLLPTKTLKHMNSTLYGEIEQNQKQKRAFLVITIMLLTKTP